MKRFWKVGALAGAVAVAATALASGIVSMSFGGGSGALAAPAGEAASTPAPADAPSTIRPTLVAAAIGTLNEDDGGSATVDLRAAIRSGNAGGALRFFADDIGYYNGGVRTFVVENGVIKVTGGGGLFKPDGTRVQVRYRAEFAVDGSSATIHVMGKDLNYTLTGSLDGYTHVWTPPAAATADA